ncbi:TPA: hypothetical protein N0F65_009994 [Lagenidium giganteum]|uniref:Uncharacterized protein n=1 Tax=Lagenidium giganteum TaxID=4803 RepID=A0AAV2ZHZ2_9STRA|nr:TPA: hypothetical protein N0F65_009994 [Lagenidium giganteum]
MKLFQSRSISMSFVAEEQLEGVSARVSQSIGTQRLRALDPILLLDELYTGLPGGSLTTRTVALRR